METAPRTWAADGLPNPAFMDSISKRITSVADFRARIEKDR